MFNELKEGVFFSMLITDIPLQEDYVLLTVSYYTVPVELGNGGWVGSYVSMISKHIFQMNLYYYTMCPLRFYELLPARFHDLISPSIVASDFK